jgi:hypothetical protein
MQVRSFSGPYPEEPSFEKVGPIGVPALSPDPSGDGIHQAGGLGNPFKNDGTLLERPLMKKNRADRLVRV